MLIDESFPKPLSIYIEFGFQYIINWPLHSGQKP